MYYRIIFAVFFCCIAQFSFAQIINYSEILKADDRDINFEILGNLGGHTLIYKNKDKRHRLTLYDNNMKLVNDVELDFIADKTFNIDFVVYPDFFYAVYQYQRGGSVFCNGAKIDPQGKLVGNIIPLDTAKIGFFADNKIYYLDASENKQKLLVYKAQNKNDNLYLNALVFNKDFVKIDGLSESYEINQRRDSYSDMKIDNDGTFYLIKEKQRGRNDYDEKAEILYHRPGSTGFISKEIPLKELSTTDMQLKIDNQNNQLFVNSFSYNKNQGNVNGLVTIAYNKESVTEKLRSIYPFSDSLRRKLTSTNGNARNPFDNFDIKNVVAKRDSGILITLEESYTDNRGIYNNRFDRYGYWNDPYNYYSTPGYYRFQRGYYDNYYSPYNRYSNNSNILYNYNDIIMVSLNSKLGEQWGNIINKKQSAVETDNFLSFSTVNLGGELHYLYLLKDNNKQVISDNALQPDGEIKRYPTIKSGEKGFDFMPRLAKQVSANAVVIPCINRNSIGFAKIFFEN